MRPQLLLALCLAAAVWAALMGEGASTTPPTTAKPDAPAVPKPVSAPDALPSAFLGPNSTVAPTPEFQPPLLSASHFQWLAADWGDCPACGRNITHTRKVTCANGLGAVQDEAKCAAQPKPAPSRVCNAASHCEWREEAGPCAAPCGSGMQSVKVSCVVPGAKDPKALAEEFCPGPKPRGERACKAVKACVWNTVGDGQCSASCGPGHRTLKASCIEPGKPAVALPESMCQGVAKPTSLVKCQNRPCAWESKATSPCSQPCGKGQQSVSSTCKDPLSGEIVPSKQCGDDPPPSFQYCSLRECQWATTPFGSCSSTCGRGTQYFNVTCRDSKTGHRVDDAQCASLPAPPKTEAPCENNACGWRARPLGQCSAPCGPGVQKFNVTCEDPITGALIDEKLCGESKPPATSPCLVRSCHWHRTVKGECSASCGPGIQAYALSCRNPADGSVQKHSQCKDVSVPPLSEPCHLHSCEWHVQNDGKCSALCGPGRQKRTVSCHDPVSQKRVPTEHCTGKMPSTNTKCYAASCVWHSKPVTQCSTQCGLGTQQVNVTCMDPELRTVLPNSQCYDASRPNSTQSCMQKECKWAAAPASVCSHSCGKGTQKLAVTCRDPTSGAEKPLALCDPASRPANNQTCFVKPCTWVADQPIGKCSQPCGPGHVEVNITCQDAAVGSVMPDRLCEPEPRPAAMKPCQLSECVWNGNWTQCAQKCGGAFQYATYRCETPEGEAISNAQCKTQPPAWRQCSTQACTDIPEAFLHYSFDAESGDGDLSKLGAPVANRVSNAAKLGLHGKVQGAGAKSVPGRGGHGTALALSASGDHTSGPHVLIPAGEPLTSPSFSLSFWLRLLSQPTAGRFYILLDNRGTNGGGEGFVVYLDPRDGLLYLNDAYSAKLGKSHFADSGKPFPTDGQWHHVAITYNQKLVRFFLDGAQSSVVDPSHTFQFTVDISKHDVYLRGSPDAYWRYLPLAIDDFAYFSYPLKADQVAVLGSTNATNTCAAGHVLTGGGCAPLLNPGSALDYKCAKGSPYSLAECLQPLWGLNGCDALGSSYPTSAADLALWNGKTWAEVKAAVSGLAARDVEPQLQAKKLWGSCRNRNPSGLDTLCNHPAPFHTSVCLQGLFLELGCSRRAAGFPASASHPLARQLNELSWRDVKAKLRHIVDTDVKGGASEGVCHDPVSLLDAQ